jgi:hypothetical protein
VVCNKEDSSKMSTYNRHAEGFDVTILGSERPMLYTTSQVRAEWRWSTTCIHPTRHPVLHDSKEIIREG